MPKRTCPATPDLFSTPRPVRAFAPEKVRAASLAAQISRGVGVALKECGKDRAAIARAMSQYLGEAVSPDMLDKYASEAAETYIINVVRFIALIAATGDRRLLQLVAEPFGWAVVENRHVEAIEYAALMEEKAEIDRRLAAKRDRIKASGALR